MICIVSIVHTKARDLMITMESEGVAVALRKGLLSQVCAIDTAEPIFHD